MELRHLRYFQAVARELSFTRAAEQLHIAQPPLSRQIRELEEQLGVVLFERTTRSLKLTEAGRFLNEQSQLLTARLEEIVEATRRIAKGSKRWFGIGFVPSTLYGVMPRILRGMRELDTQVEVGLLEMTTLQQIAALKARRIDIGFGRILIEDAGITRKIIASEPLWAALPAEHRLLAKASLAVEDIANEDFILYPARPRPSYADQVLGLFREAGVTIQVVQEANELQTAVGLVASGVGITLVPESVKRLHRDDVAYRPLKARSFASPVIMSYRYDDDSPYLKNMIALVSSLTQQA